LKSFNLIDEPWIPILGQSEPASLAQALLEAQNFTRIEHASPLSTVAIYRLLLAVLHRALEGPDNESIGVDIYERGEFPKEPVQKYLKQWHDHFWLFHPERPFYQMPDLPLEGFCDPWTRLAAEYGSGNTSFLTNHALREKNPQIPYAISYAEATCRLLEFHSFALGGTIQRFVTSAPGGPAVQGVLLLVDGENLFEQLAANLVPYDANQRKRDRPIWEKGPYLRSQLDKKEGFRESIGGITSLYTWFGRSIRLFGEDGKVSQVAISAGVVPAPGLESAEPMFAFTFDKDGKPRPLGFREGREFWRDFHALLPGPKSTHRPGKVIEHAIALCNQLHHLPAPTIRIYGICKNKAKVLGTHCESFKLPEMVRSDFDLATWVKVRLDEVDDISFELQDACKMLAKKLLTMGTRKPRGKDLTALATSFRSEEAYFPQVRREFLLLLSQMPTEQDAFYSAKQELEANWRGKLQKLALRAFDSAESAAGSNARALKACAESRRLLRGRLRKIVTPEKETVHV